MTKNRVGGAWKISSGAKTVQGKVTELILLVVLLGIFGFLIAWDSNDVVVEDDASKICPEGQNYSKNWNQGFGAIRSGVTIYTGGGNCKTPFGSVTSVDTEKRTAMVDRGSGPVEMDLDVLQQGGYFSP